MELIFTCEVALYVRMLHAGLILSSTHRQLSLAPSRSLVCQISNKRSTQVAGLFPNHLCGWLILMDLLGAMITCIGAEAIVVA